jgi:hypothetical protein
VTRRVMLVVLSLTALAVAGCGGNDGGSNGSAAGSRTVRIEMRELSFSPASVDVTTKER